MTKVFKIALAVCLLATSANAVTVYGNSAQLNAAGTVTDCNGAGAYAGTNAKAVSLALPSWAAGADIDIGGTFVGTWAIEGSVDGVIYRGVGGISSANRLLVQASTVPLAASVADISIRYVCVVVSAYTSGTFVIVIEPRATPAGFYSLMANGSSGGGGALEAGSAVIQGGVSTGGNSLLVTVNAGTGINSTPAVNTQASASVALVAAVRHIAQHCSGSINTVAAQPAISLNLRDGATGAGTIVWSQVITCALGASCVLDSGPINILGTAATAMTCEWAGIPAVGNFEVANLEYKNAG